MDTLLLGRVAPFDVTVVVDAEAVADLPAPATSTTPPRSRTRCPTASTATWARSAATRIRRTTATASRRSSTARRSPTRTDPTSRSARVRHRRTARRLGVVRSGRRPDHVRLAIGLPGRGIRRSPRATPTLSVNSPPPCPVACEADADGRPIPMDLSDTEDTSVTIQDTKPPTITVQLTPDELRPPNHKMVDITATVVAEDLCDPHPSIVLTSIVSDEPDDARATATAIPPATFSRRRSARPISISGCAPNAPGPATGESIPSPTPRPTPAA